MVTGSLDAEVIDSSRAGSALSDVVIRTGGSVRGGRQYAALEEAATPAEAQQTRAESTTPRAGGRTDQTNGKAAGGHRQVGQGVVCGIHVWRSWLQSISLLAL